MCGLLGIYDFAAGAHAPLDETRFGEALFTLRHRGPDALVQETVAPGLLMGHARLSIIDLSEASNQPLHYADRYSLIYNGEIYNYLELRDELTAAGLRFATTGDAEVLLAAYAHWGPDCVKRFNGMWAFAIYDHRDRVLFCSRDRFGVKPFNYAVENGRLFFASEIKAILAYRPSLAIPDYTAIANFVRTSVGAQHAQTWFAGVKRLPPGTNMTVSDGKIAIDRYWNYPPRNDAPPSFEAATEEFRRLFDDAVRIRMRSDVPLGLTLSSGVDSTAIAYAMQSIDPTPHYCYTARFAASDKLVQDGAIYREAGSVIDESIVARQVANDLGLRSEVVETDYGCFVPRLAKIVRHLESGNSSPAVVPLMQLLEAARRNLTVILEGQGADELLGGYILSLFWPGLFDELRRGRFGAALASLRKFMRTYTLRYSVLMGLRDLSNRFPAIATLNEHRSGVAKALGPKLKNRPRLQDFPAYADQGKGGSIISTLRHQHAGGLVNLLHYGDAISMANSLESRMPFLDFRLVEYAWGLPSEYKLRLGTGKRVLREALRGRVPEAIIDNHTKYGFTTPISEQFRKVHVGADPIEILLSERCLKREVFAADGLRRLIEAHRSGAVDHGPLLFRMLSTELWFREFID